MLTKYQCCKHFVNINSFNPVTSLGESVLCLYFIDGETEAQRNYMDFPE